MTDVHDVHTVRVDLGERGYDIVIGAGLTAEPAAYLGPLVRGRRAVVVTDERVAGTHLDGFVAALAPLAGSVDTITVPPGEATKSFAGLEAVVNRLLDLGVDRTSVLIAFGGGVVGDVAGFAAAVFMRGIDLVQIPTTLMAQVDSAVGGKNAINARHGKNLVGTFHQPRLVLDDVALLDTLPDRELRAGYAEVVKCALIEGDEAFKALEASADALLARDRSALIAAVRLGCATKGRIVTADERDRGDRALVNLGHTFAHALEAQAGYGAILHGEAVAAGLAAATALSVRLGLCDPALESRVRRHLARVGLPSRIAELPTNHPFTALTLIDHMAHDKKTVGGAVHFVLLRGTGAPFVTAAVEHPTLVEVLDAEIARA